ncbi:MAG TPA: helix-turn-helix transcriptional regulator [Ktedonobacteraceae bacterium]|jgi:tetratricopeptide (TPR) repeat protein
MPRPSKHVSPDTLGGRIRAAREQLQLSLADVADGHYSTSLISQIERNRIDPSQESLRFLAARLRLSLEDLEVLAQQHREAEIESRQYKSYEDLRAEVVHYYINKDFCKAIALLCDLQLSKVPISLRWRIAALRGQCHFEMRKFLKAHQDFMYAVGEQPRGEGLPTEQHHELILLHLHLAATYRELQQLDDALEQYRRTLHMMNSTTPFGYVAEAHWGIALLTFAQANSMQSINNKNENTKILKLRSALEHAENARFLYRAIDDQLRVAMVTCQIAQIEHLLGSVEKVRSYLEEVLSIWSSSLSEPPAVSLIERRYQQDAANVVSASACSLAGIELEAKNYQEALYYVNLALEAGKRCYILRRADAYLMRGRILEAIDPYNPETEEAFRYATQELAGTQRIAARISAHVRLGRYLLKIGKIESGEQELEQARFLSDLVSVENTSTLSEDTVRL